MSVNNIFHLLVFTRDIFICFLIIAGFSIKTSLDANELW